jgi:S1-C subfamily serine protease
VDLDTTAVHHTGAPIAAVNRGGPAARGGLRAGDVVMAINGARVENTRELIRDVSTVNPGSVAHLRVHRGGQTIELAVIVGRRPPDPPQSEQPDAAEPDQ